MSGLTFGGTGFGGTTATTGRGTFLLLCQRTAVECGVASDSAILSVLPSVVGATGSLGRVVNWVNDAWTDLQMDRDDWEWMRSSVVLGAGAQFPTVDGQASYALGTDTGQVGIEVEAFGKWADERGAFRCYPTGVGIRGEQELAVKSYEVWRRGYMLGTNRLSKTRPGIVAIGPDQSVCLGPPPLAGYTITADYFIAPTLMVANDDRPYGLPSRFQMLIVYKAMEKYGGYESAPEVKQRGMEEGATMYAQLIRAREERPYFAGALA